VVSQKAYNTIWRISSHRGTIYENFDSISEVGVSHYKALYTQYPKETLRSVLSIASTFPNWINEHDNENLMAPIYEQELKRAVLKLQANKSSGSEQTFH
jgi:hypothetical protein